MATPRSAPAFGGALAGQSLVPIGKLAANPLRVELRTKKIDDGTGGLIDQQVKFPIWLDPSRQRPNPDVPGLRLGLELASTTSSVSIPTAFRRSSSTSPTARRPTATPSRTPAACATSPAGTATCSCSTFTCPPAAIAPIELPDSEDDLPDDFARLLFRMSSVLPPAIRETAKREGYLVSNETRGFVFNADLVSVIRFLDIGTRVDMRHLR